jgi:hypothetical protein
VNPEFVNSAGAQEDPLKDAAQIVIVLDRSGSMEVVRETTIESFNRFLAKQKEIAGEADVYFAQFNTEYQLLYDRPLKHAPELNYATYQPNGGTALYDAVGHTIDTLGQRFSAVPENERPNKVIFMVLTDGLENSSHTYSQQMIADRIDHQRNKYSWEFVFLGANQDAVVTARGMNIPRRAAMTFCAAPPQTVAAWEAAGDFLVRARRGLGADFSDEQRARAMGGGENRTDEEKERSGKDASSVLSWLRRKPRSAAPQP